MKLNEIDYVDTLMRWYAADNEDWISIRRSEVGYLLEQIGVKEK